MNYEQTQEALLRIIDSLKPDISSSEMGLLSGAIGAIHAEPEKADNRIARACLEVYHALARINNERGFKYGLSLSAKALRTMPPMVELIENKDDYKPTVFDCQVLDLKELRK